MVKTERNVEVQTLASYLFHRLFFKVATFTRIAKVTKAESTAL